MIATLRVIRLLIHRTVLKWWADNATQLAAALSFYAFFSIAPLLIIAVTVAGLFYDAVLAREALMGQMQELVGFEGADLLDSIMVNLQSQHNSSLPTWVGVGTILAGATGVFAELKNSLNRIWDAEAKPVGGLWGLIRTRFLSFAMVLGIGFLLLVSLIFSALMAALDSYLDALLPGYEQSLRMVNLVLSYGVTTLLFAMIFKFLPDVNVRWRNVWLGAAVTAVLFAVGKNVIGFYLGNSAISSIYGAAGSMAVLLFWVYYSAQILFLGAEFTRVYTLWQDGIL